MCCCNNNRGYRGAGDAASRYAQEHYPSTDAIYEPRPRRRHDPMERWRGEPGVPPGAGRRLPRPRGAGYADPDRWRSPRDDYYAGGRRFDARGDYHPQRLMRGMDGLDGPSARFSSWRSRYDDDYPPERTELWAAAAAGDGGRHRGAPDPSASAARGHQHRLDPTLRNDSLSSDPSDCMSAPAAVPTAAAPGAAARLTPKHHRARPHKNGGGGAGGGPGGGAGAGSSRSRRQSSMSSSDDGVQTTPEGTSAEEQEIESESIVSEMGACVRAALEFFHVLSIPVVSDGGSRLMTRRGGAQEFWQRSRMN